MDEDERPAVSAPRARVMRSHQAARTCDHPPAADLIALGVLVRQARTEAGLSTRGLALRASCARSTVQRLERGLLQPRRSLLAWVAYGIDPDRNRELLVAFIDAAGGAAALAPDGRWGARRGRSGLAGIASGQVPLPREIARRVALHIEAAEAFKAAYAIADLPGVRDDAEALTRAAELMDVGLRADRAAGGVISIGTGRHRVTYGMRG